MSRFFLRADGNGAPDKAQFEKQVRPEAQIICKNFIYSFPLFAHPKNCDSFIVMQIVYQGLCFVALSLCYTKSSD